MDPIYIRLIERLAIVIISGLCIYWGYRLFFVATQKQGDFKFGSEFLKVHLASVAPGIYFSLFGSLILIFAIFSKVDFTYAHASRNEIEGQSRQISRGIASESSAIVTYINPDGLPDDLLKAAETASELIDTLHPFLDSETAAEMIDPLKLSQLRMNSSKSVSDKYWSDQLSAADSPRKLLNAARALLSYIDLIGRYNAEVVGGRSEPE